MKKIIIAFAVFIGSVQFVLAGEALSVGLNAYECGDWSGAIVAFKKEIASSDPVSTEAWYWLVMAELSAGDYTAALRDADYFLSAWPDDKRLGDMLYQKGRILYNSDRYNDAVSVLGDFVLDFSDHALVSSAYYWLGESLFSLGRFNEADALFAKVIADYPLSVKKEPAAYKRSIITQKAREEELLEIIKWTHEESLRVIEEYQRREKNYEQALNAYQKRVADMLKDSHMADLEEALAQEQNKNSALAQQNAELKKLNDDLTVLMETKYNSQNSPASSNIIQRLNELKAKASELEGSSASAPYSSVER